MIKNIFLIFLISVMLCKAQTPKLLADINSDPVFERENGVIPYPHNFCQIGDIIYFACQNGFNGIELWRTDGTTNGTYMVKDIYTGSASSEPALLTKVGNTLYFFANNGINGNELWKSDGTENGTVLVKDLVEGLGSPLISDFRVHSAINNIFIFSVNMNNIGYELYRSDGTSNGTYLLKDINLGFYGSDPGYTGSSFKNNWFEYNGYLYFKAGYFGDTFWKTDGSIANTVSVTNINFGTIKFGTIKDNKLYFMAGENVSPYRRGLWQTDGLNTTLISQIEIGGTSCEFFMKTFANRVVFNAYSTISGNELWESDGSIGNVNIIKDIYAGNYSSNPINEVVLGSNIFFSAENQNNGIEIWKTDGTNSNTVLIKDIKTQFSGGSANSGTPSELVSFNSNIYFFAYDNSNKAYLWKTDGLEQNTTKVSEIAEFHYPDGSCTIDSYLFATSQRLIFLGFNASTGFGIYSSDGTNAGTYLVKIPNPTTKNSSVDIINTLTDRLVIYDNSSPNSDAKRIWISDGTPENTNKVNKAFVWQWGEYNEINKSDYIYLMGGPSIYTSPANVMAYDSLYRYNVKTHEKSFIGKFGHWFTEGGPPQYIVDYPRETFELNGQTFFTISTPQYGMELWKTNGTQGGTVLVKDLYPGYIGGIEFYKAIKKNDTLYFPFTYDVFNDQEAIYQTDGTENGTHLVINKRCKAFFELNGQVYFYNNDGIWATDLTASGTTLVRGNINISGGRVFNNVFYFGADENGTNNGIWSFNGSNVNFIKPLNIYPGYADMYYCNNLVFFGVNGNTGFEYWRTDGTSIGTFKVINGYSAAQCVNNKLWIGKIDGFNQTISVTDGSLANTHLLSNSSYSYAFGEKIFVGLNGFTYFSTANGLYKSDGTPSGTTLVKSFINCEPSFVKNNKLYFMATTADEGQEVWSSDGTTNGTTIIDDLFLGNGNGAYGQIKQFTDTKYYFIGNNGISGKEPFVLDFTCPQTLTLTIANNLNAEAKNFSANNSIIATNKISGNSNSTYSAFNQIQLNPGFEVSKGSVFKTDFNGCQ